VLPEIMSNFAWRNDVWISRHVKPLNTNGLGYRMGLAATTLKPSSYSRMDPDVLMEILRKTQFLSREDRAFHTGSSVVRGAIVHPNSCDAAETDPESARHGRFQGQPAGDPAGSGDFSDRMHHRFRSAAVDGLRRSVAGNLNFQQVRDKSMVTATAIIS
jgi:hypothetical protein